MSRSSGGGSGGSGVNERPSLIFSDLRIRVLGSVRSNRSKSGACWSLRVVMPGESRWMEVAAAALAVRSAVSSLRSEYHDCSRSIPDQLGFGVDNQRRGDGG